MAHESRGNVIERGSATTPTSAAAGKEEFEPRTPLGRKLWALRQQIIASGIPVLTAEEIEAELAERVLCYRPDFLIRLASGTALVLEVKGKDTPQDRAKRAALDEWIAAVNEHGGFGRWA